MSFDPPLESLGLLLCSVKFSSQMDVLSLSYEPFSGYLWNCHITIPSEFDPNLELGATFRLENCTVDYLPMLNSALKFSEVQLLEKWRFTSFYISRPTTLENH